MSDDNTLLEELKAGDMNAFEKVFNKYHKLLSIEAYHLLGDEMEADDIVQVLFIELWDKKYYKHIDQSLKAYLRTALRNKCLTRLSKGITDKKRLDTYILNTDVICFDDKLERREVALGMETIINDLPAQRLHAFNLVYLQQKKYKEAAAEMGITPNSLKTHLKLAVKTLREKFRKIR